MLTLRYDHLVGLLVEGAKSLKTGNDALKARLEKVEKALGL